MELSFSFTGLCSRSTEGTASAKILGSSVGRHIRKPAWLQWSVGTEVKPTSPQGLDPRTFERC